MASIQVMYRSNFIRCLVNVHYITIIILLITHPTLQQSPKLSISDLHALLSIKNSLINLPGSTFFSSWDFTAQDPCPIFEGVTCTLLGDSNTLLRVTALELGTGLEGSLGLAGSLPGSVTQLTELTQLILNPGMVTGPIPAQLGHLSNLRVLSLAHNRLTGPIPRSITALSQLHTLDLSFNQLTGSIPPSLLSELAQLRVLVLASNQLSGELPELTNSHPLLHLDLKSNRFVGPMPSTLPTTLRYLSLSRNLMWGSLNGQMFKSLTDLSYLDLSFNQFNGALPMPLFRSILSTVLLNHNNFSVNMSMSDIVLYPEGSVIDLSHNGLFGELPEAAAGAESVFLNNNRFSGPIPQAYVSGLSEGRIKTLYLQHNFLDEFPKKLGANLPDEVEVCLAYNCMVPPVGLETCPTSAGDQLSRPATQCSVFHNGGAVQSKV